MTGAVVLLILSPVWSGMIAWGGLALWIDGPRSRWIAGMLAASFVLGSVVVLAVVAPVGLALGWLGVGFMAVLVWWRGLEPSNDREWQEDVERLARAEVSGDLVRFHNVRDFQYREPGDHVARWETRELDLGLLEGVDLFLCYWGPRKIAHTILSFVFGEQGNLAVSIETRREKGESYSALRGFFRQFELYYVVGDERDVIRLRTNVRGERVYLYRLTMSPEQSRELFMDYVGEIDRLVQQPRWYNALTTNCTTTIRYHARNIADRGYWDWRLLVNGYVDEMGYERGIIDTSLPFGELRERSDITERARAAGGGADFSERIRDGLPNPRHRG